MGLRERRERVECATVTKRYGAWLVVLSGPELDVTPDELFDCASSLAVAKRRAREMAAAVGYLPAWRWSQDDLGRWRLEGTEVGDEYDGEFD